MVNGLVDWTQLAISPERIAIAQASGHLQPVILLVAESGACFFPPTTGPLASADATVGPIFATLLSRRTAQLLACFLCVMLVDSMLAIY